MSVLLRLTTLALSTSLLACTTAGTEQTATDLTSTCPVSGTLIDHSLAITDSTVLAKFGFQRTMKQVLKSSGANTGQTATKVYQQWMSTFGDTDCTNPRVDPNGYGEVCPRTHEAKLATIDPFAAGAKVTFKPVALFNRFDLAPKNGATCGEYRIIYAMSSTDPNIGGRGLYIFEAALPNPSPADKLAGCLPIAEFWQNLSNLSFADIATQLEKFYYLGTAIPNVGPVVDARNYGLSHDGGPFTAGQIRTNMFIDGFQWHLREFKTELDCTGTSCSLALDHVSTKNNPADALFAGTAKKSDAFLTAFPKRVAALAATDITAIGMTTADQFNTFESVSEPEGLQGETKVAYDRLTDAALTSAIQAQLDALGNTTLTPTHILRRATTQTCAGCHQISQGTEAQLGGGLTWPSSAQFVQVTESGAMSTALTKFFLPHRMTVLEDFINSLCGGGTTIADDGLTIGGSEVGAAN